MLVNKQVFMETGSLLLSFVERVRESPLPYKTFPKDKAHITPPVGFSSLCRSSIDLELDCGYRNLEEFLHSLSPKIFANIRSIIINDYTVSYLCKMGGNPADTEPDAPKFISFLKQSFPGLKEIEICYDETIERSNTEVATGLMRLIDEGFLDTFRLIFDENIDSPSSGADELLAGLNAEFGLDLTEFKKPETCVEIVRCNGQHSILQDQQDTELFYSGTGAWYTGNKKVPIVRIYRSKSGSGGEESTTESTAQPAR
ncbi:hypothetical protein HYFRA_00006131 [Hymenoscyphus fraxineus]|uniref:Uncharacterized protein n=1 Tax=Hymenoscyphus fraxineus TaxID=746836 RepID=A0A9N9PVP4_9HELO|nr:hypothetical protein HYFRA_00006131 [Hymenoscyphus fraxineus]